MLIPEKMQKLAAAAAAIDQIHWTSWGFPEKALSNNGKTVEVSGLDAGLAAKKLEVAGGSGGHASDALIQAVQGSRPANAFLKLQKGLDRLETWMRKRHIDTIKVSLTEVATAQNSPTIEKFKQQLSGIPTLASR